MRKMLQKFWDFSLIYVYLGKTMEKQWRGMQKRVMCEWPLIDSYIWCVRIYKSNVTAMDSMNPHINLKLTSCSI